MTFRFLALAQAELLEGISYYSFIRPELGLRFEQEVTDAVRLLLLSAAHRDQRALEDG